MVVIVIVMVVIVIVMVVMVIVGVVIVIVELVIMIVMVVMVIVEVVIVIVEVVIVIVMVVMVIVVVDMVIVVIARFGNISLVRMLLDEGADKGLVDLQGMTAKDHAKEKDCITIIGDWHRRYPRLFLTIVCRYGR